MNDYKYEVWSVSDHDARDIKNGAFYSQSMPLLMGQHWDVGMPQIHERVKIACQAFNNTVGIGLNPLFVPMIYNYLSKLAPYYKKYMVADAKEVYDSIIAALQLAKSPCSIAKEKWIVVDKSHRFDICIEGKSSALFETNTTLARMSYLEIRAYLCCDTFNSTIGEGINPLAVPQLVQALISIKDKVPNKVFPTMIFEQVEAILKSSVMPDDYLTDRTKQLASIIKKAA